jgi:hypothetical protein
MSAAAATVPSLQKKDPDSKDLKIVPKSAVNDANSAPKKKFVETSDCKFWYNEDTRTLCEVSRPIDMINAPLSFETCLKIWQIANENKGPEYIAAKTEEMVRSEAIRQNIDDSATPVGVGRIRCAPGKSAALAALAATSKWYCCAPFAIMTCSMRFLIGQTPSSNTSDTKNWHEQLNWFEQRARMNPIHRAMPFSFLNHPTLEFMEKVELTIRRVQFTAMLLGEVPLRPRKSPEEKDFYLPWPDSASEEFAETAEMYYELFSIQFAKLLGEEKYHKILSSLAETKEYRKVARLGTAITQRVVEAQNTNCASCAHASPLLRCPCKKVFYCNQKCQAAHWKQHRKDEAHKHRTLAK